MSLEGRQSGLCATHFGTLSKWCQLCPVGDDANQLVWRSCQGVDCTRYVRACEKCSPHVSNDSFMCDMCWRTAGSKCTKCHKQNAQTDRSYMRCCVKCFSNLEEVTQMILVKADSDAYLQSISQQQQWTGMEAPLQFLMLPAPAGTPLPKYADTPEYLDPLHCRLCLASLSGTGLQAHLAESHQGYTEATYRREVLQKISRSGRNQFHRRCSGAGWLRSNKDCAMQMLHCS